MITGRINQVYGKQNLQINNSINIDQHTKKKIIIITIKSMLTLIHEDIQKENN